MQRSIDYCLVWERRLNKNQENPAWGIKGEIMKIIFIVLWFSTSICSSWGGKFVRTLEDRCCSSYTVKAYSTIEEVNKAISEERPSSVYEYNLETKEIKRIEFETDVKRTINVE